MSQWIMSIRGSGISFYLLTVMEACRVPTSWPSKVDSRLPSWNHEKLACGSARTLHGMVAVPLMKPKTVSTESAK